jgi:cyclopropane fatty-acyl-phospholipid synthase-like methyltransferase
VTLSPEEVVRRGYDAIAERYAEWASSFESPALQWVDKLLERLPDGSDVLELGCGGGSPATRALAARHRVVGVDISERQLERARRLVPEARYVRGDVTELVSPPESVDAVVSLFLLGHVPRAKQQPLLGRIFDWLVPGGLFLATLGTANADDEVEADWLGAPMFFASYDEEWNRRALESAGFVLEKARVVPVEEPGHGVVSFMWVLARKPA